jgi:pimeloyl-ACP methyl ester carboxylesterase
LKKEKKIYIFSGLGADKRVFQNIEFGNYKPIYINWILPLENEKIKQYSARISNQITEINPTILGISFGGIVAQEVAFQVNVEKLILLATFEQRVELPNYLKILGNLKIDKLIPSRFLKSYNFLTNYAFGVETKSNSKILKKILEDTDKIFLKWSLRQLAEWNPNQELKIMKKITIHGTNDKIIPKFKTKKYNYEIKGGGHFFTLTHSNEINEILSLELKF